MTRTIYYKYMMWGIKLKDFKRQAGLRYSQDQDEGGKDGKDDNVKEDNENFDMNDKDNLL